jgi:predicted RNA polymerase sigma factor
VTDEITQPLTQAVADERLRIIAGLIRVTGDWELAEDCSSSTPGGPRGRI